VEENVPVEAANSVPWRGSKWRTAVPETQGVDSAQLADIIKTIRNKDIKIRSLLIVRDGYLVVNSYFGPYREGDGVIYPVHSITKSVTSALTGVAIEEGILKGTDQKIFEAFPEAGS
jgi:CubicO group peptidase (beta-lactamase class C family)